jgi:hypothetical protein
MRKLLILLTIMAMITTSGCLKGGGGDSSSGGSSALDTSDVTLLFNLPDTLASNNSNNDTIWAKALDLITMSGTAYADPPAYTLVRSIYIRITGTGMADIIYQQNIADPSVPFSITIKVPNGPNRRIYIELRDIGANTLHSGNLTISVGTDESPEDIVISVIVKDNINAGDYVTLGRTYLKQLKLEKAYHAFGTAVNIDSNHPEARFFRGLTRSLLLFHKDTIDPVGVVEPDPLIKAALSQYMNLSNIYTSPIAPDIYSETYDVEFSTFRDNDWSEPSNFTTDSGIDVLKSVFLPELDNIIKDLEKARASASFSTTFTSEMYFGISSTIDVDRADVYIFEAIIYFLKGYINLMLADNLYTDISYWKGELDKPFSGDIETRALGIQHIIDNDPGSPKFLARTGSAQSYLNTSKSAFSTSLDRTKQGLQLIDSRGEDSGDNLFSLPDVFNMDKIAQNIDELKSSLSAETTFTSYNRYDDSTEDAKLTKINAGALFSASELSLRDSVTDNYYHYVEGVTGRDMAIFDTNDPTKSAGYVNKVKSIITQQKDSADSEWYNISTMEDILKAGLYGSPAFGTPYKFVVPTSYTVAMNGLVSDWTVLGIKPVWVDKYDSDKLAGTDLRKVYMAKDSTYFYIALQFESAPYLPPQEGAHFQYKIIFDTVTLNSPQPLRIELYRNGADWTWNVWSYGILKEEGVDLGSAGVSYKLGPDISQFKIPLSYIKEKIEQYDSNVGGGGSWDGKELCITTGFYVNISGSWHGENSADILGELNIS